LSEELADLSRITLSPDGGGAEVEAAVMFPKARGKSGKDDDLLLELARIPPEDYGL
jgi:hypothetical protein